LICPSTTRGQPSLVLPLLQVNRYPDHTYSDLRERWGSRGRPPRRNSPTKAGCRGSRPCWGFGGEVPEAETSGLPHSSEDFRCRPAGRAARAAASDVSGTQPQESVLEVELSLSRRLSLPSIPLSLYPSIPHSSHPR